MKNVRQSWAAEDAEFKRRATEIPHFQRSTRGFFQVVPDETPPTTNIKNNSFDEFLIPEEHLSLKLFFDNFRNYATCGVFAGFGSWVWFNSKTILLAHAPVWVWTSVAVTLWMLAAILLTLNCLQTWRLVRELFFSVRAIRSAKTYVLGGEQSIAHMCIGLAFLFLEWIVDVALCVLILFFSAAVVAVSVGLVGYAVLQAQR